MTELTFEVLLQGAENRVLDCGIALPYRELCSAFTVEKLSMWEHLEDNQFQVLLLQAHGLPTARVEGTLYDISHEEIKELDKQRGNGVECRRKFLPVWAEFQGAFRRTHAWVYIHQKERWVERITFDQNFRHTEEGRTGRNFRLSDRAPDTNPLLNNRFTFADPVYNNGHVGEVSERMRKKIRDMNRLEIRRLNKERRWTALKYFLSESEEPREPLAPSSQNIKGRIP